MPVNLEIHLTPKAGLLKDSAIFLTNMKAIYILSTLLLFFYNCYSQVIKERQLSLGVLYSRHGSGDINGVMVDVGYEFNLKDRFSFYNNLSFTLHSGKEIFYDLTPQPTNPDYQTQPLNFVTAGIQSSPTIFYSLINGKKQRFKIGVGGVIRYQANSFPDRYLYYYRSNNWDEPFYIIKEIQPSVFTVGYKISFNYVFINKLKTSYSFIGSYQNDTNGDLIFGLGFQIARKLFK